MRIKRRRTRKIKVGSVYIGGGAPIAIQSMAKTDTRDARAVIDEIKKLEKAGCEIVRVAVKDEDSALALKLIKKSISIPLVADIHFSAKLAMLAIANGADKIRVNPGNTRDEEGLIKVVKFAKKQKVPVRIGLNSGSVPRGMSMIKLAQHTIKLFERNGFHDTIISLKGSDALGTIDAYRRMASFCDYPLHLGVTAAGLPEKGIVKSSICIGALLLDGIGDTVRISLTADPAEEVRAAKNILSALGIRRFGHEIIACPTCGRCQMDLKKIVNELTERLESAECRDFCKRPLRVAVMGCEVNGPGEARDADIGIAAGRKSGALFVKGKVVKKIKEKDFVNTLIKELKTISHKP